MNGLKYSNVHEREWECQWQIDSLHYEITVGIHENLSFIVDVFLLFGGSDVGLCEHLE